MPLPCPILAAIRPDPPSRLRAFAGTATAFAAAGFAALLPAPAPLFGVADALVWAGLDRAGAIGLSLALLFGLFAWHLARIATPGWLHQKDALPAAWIAAALMPPLLLPQAGSLALIPPIFLTLVAIRHGGRTRFVAAMVQCGAIAHVVGLANPGQALLQTCCGALTIALFHAFRPASPAAAAANDNPLLIRNHRIPSLYLQLPHVTFGPFRIRGVGNHVHVQQ